MKQIYLSFFGAFFLFLFSNNLAHSQCPLNEADLANGGTFSGDCTVNVGGSIIVTGTIIWTSGRLTINDSGAGGDGDLTIVAPGQIIIQNGATLDMDDGDITINNGGTLTIESGGSVEILDNDRELYVNTGGTLNVAGNLAVNNDIEIDGGTANINPGAIVNAGDDFIIEGNANVNIANGSTVTMGDEFFIDDSDVTIAGAVSSSSNDDINISGTSTVIFEDGADVNFNDMEFGTGDGQTQVIINGGNVNLNGEVDFNNGQDGDAIVVNGGVLDVGNDIELGTTDGTITINSGGTVIAPSIDGNTYTEEGDLPDNIILNDDGLLILNGVTLPVVLVYFKGQVVDNQDVLLLWQTSSELNNRGFYVQKSINGVDFSSIGFVEGAGTSKKLVDYQFTDRSFNGQAYYRLMQVDFDEAFEHGPVIFISSQKGLLQTLIYPNPVQSEIQIQSALSTQLHVKVLDINGKILFSAMAQDKSAAEGQLNEFVPNMKAGIYFLSLQSLEGSTTTRFVKQ